MQRNGILSEWHPLVVGTIGLLHDLQLARDPVVLRRPVGQKLQDVRVDATVILLLRELDARSALLNLALKSYLSHVESSSGPCEPKRG